MARLVSVGAARSGGGKVSVSVCLNLNTSRYYWVWRITRWREKFDDIEFCIDETAYKGNYVDNLPIWVQILILVVLLAVSGFSISETSMMAINRFRLRHLAKQNNRAAKRTQGLLDQTERLLGVILVAIMVIRLQQCSQVQLRRIIGGKTKLHCRLPQH